MRVLKTFAIALLLTPCLAPPAHAADPLIVRIDTGRLEGALSADGKVKMFLGIPYAKPPIDELRWKPPVHAEKWKKVRPAREFGFHCPQFESFGDMKFHDPGESEDCLTVNVWAPSSAKPGTLPVMVWIHGGGFLAGGSSESRQDGEYLAQLGVVVVSMNYRLGIFGFMAHPDLEAESPHHAAGNYGLLDQAAALEWVKDNITDFGGNPANVTIFGESAGSFSVSALMASPVADGLFHKAIGESGAAYYNASFPFGPREPLEEATVAFAQTNFGTSSLSYLRTLPTKDIMAPFQAGATIRPPDFEPVIDGYFLNSPVPDSYSGGASKIPLLAGWNADEARSTVVLRKEKTTAAAFTALAQQEFGDQAARFLALYPAHTDAEAENSASDLAGDKFIAFSTWRWIESHATSRSAPTYRYLFDLPSPGDRYHPVAAGAFHSDEIEYAFGTLDSRTGANWRPEDRTLSIRMSQYWTNFAKTGNPNGPGLPTWPTYTPGFQVMYLDATPHAKPDPSRPRYLFLDNIWSR